jgi:hypothetical protein
VFGLLLSSRRLLLVRIRARKTTVAQILAHYRAAYAPAEGSSLINSGDPSDGADSYIGAVGTGKDSPNDYFGRFHRPTAKSESPREHLNPAR